MIVHYNPIIALSIGRFFLYVLNLICSIKVPSIHIKVPSIQHIGMKVAIFFIRIYTILNQCLSPLYKYFNPITYIPYKYKIKEIKDEDLYEYNCDLIKPEHFNYHLFATIEHQKTGFEYRVYLKNINELIRIREAMNEEDKEEKKENDTQKLEHKIDHRNILFGNAIIEIKNKENITNTNTNTDTDTKTNTNTNNHTKEKTIEIPIELLYIYAGPEGNFFENELMLENREEYLYTIFNEMLPRPYKAWRKIHNHNHNKDKDNEKYVSISDKALHKWIIGDEEINEDIESYNLKKVEIFTVDGEQVEYSFRV